MSLLIAVLLAAALPSTAVRWFDGTWDAAGAPRGCLLSDNPRWFGDRIFTGVTYAYEVPPIEPADPGCKLLLSGPTRGVRRHAVGRPDGKSIVSVFDFRRPCAFSEVDIVSTVCTSAIGFVEFSADRTNWTGRCAFDVRSALTRVKFASDRPGRFLRVSFAAKSGSTVLDEVLVWGAGEVSADYPEAIAPIPRGEALLFPDAARDKVSILPMRIPHLDVKPSGGTPDGFSLTLVRNETESRYFAVVNGTAKRKTVALTAPDFGPRVKTELLIGGVLPVTPPPKERTKEEMVLLSTNERLSEGVQGKLDLLPFFFAHARGRDNFRRRYLANPEQVAGFPKAVPLEPGEGCVILLRVTTEDAPPGRRRGILAAGPAGLGFTLDIADLLLPPQRTWIYAYEPFTSQFPFESVARLSRDSDRYAEIGATSVKALPERGTKERIFFRRVPSASVGCEDWCDSDVWKRVTKGGFDGLSEGERETIVSNAAQFLSHACELGVPEDRLFAFLPDEPRLSNGRSVMKLAALVKSRLPDLLLYCDPHFWKGGKDRFASAQEIREALQPEYDTCVDASCPYSYLVKERPELLDSLWRKPRRIKAMYNAPAGNMGREKAYLCRRLGFNGFAYYCYCHPGIPDLWDIRRYGVLDFNYQAVLPVDGDVALTPLYETLREAAEDFRLMDAIADAGRHDLLESVLARAPKAWDRTRYSYAHFLRDRADDEDVLDLRASLIRPFERCGD